jgi:hypothetical protein
MDITQLPTATDAIADDAMLARLDFANDALILNLGALSHFGNPFLVDVVASSLLAVAVAESVRGRGKKSSRNGSTEHFEPPPPSSLLGKKEPSTAQVFKESFVEGFEGFGGKTKVPVSSSLRKWATRKDSGIASVFSHSNSHSVDKDIELGEWYGQPSKPETKKQRKQREKEEKGEKLPFVARAVIGVLSFAFKTVVFVLKIAIKIVAGVVVMITRNFGRL